jgi:hypothetical protein
MKKKLLIALAVISLLVFFIPATAQAQGGLTVSPGMVMVNFPNSIIIGISAQSDVNITDIRVHYTVERHEFAKVIAEARVAFTPATAVNTQWVWDMRLTGALPPGTSVTYWLTVTDSSGDSVETLPSTVQFDDNRYTWKTLQEGQITLFWYSGDDSFAEELMAAAQTALTKLSDTTGASLTSNVKLYIYANTTDLQGAMINPQEWTGGVAFSQYDTIAIGIDPTTQVVWGKSTIAHELTHLVVYQVTANPYNELPTWLNEGLAMYAQGALDPSLAAALAIAEAQKTLISVRSLCSQFSAYPDQARLAYAESYQIVTYLINEYGRDKMFELLNTFKRGSGYDEALLKVYGFDMDALNTMWQTEMVTVQGNVV